MSTSLLRLASFSMLLATALPVFAQEQVTVVRRNGDRVSGRFEDWNRQTDTVYVRVTPSNQATFPMRDVLVIAVGGDANNLPDAERTAAAGGNHVLVTRGGQMLSGRLVNIEGGEGSARADVPRTVTFQAGGERRFAMQEVARLYLGNYPQTSSGSGSATVLPAGAIRVPGNQQWTATNIVIRPGDRVQFSVTGELRLSTDPEDKAISAGSTQGRRAPNSPAPQYLAGALLGRIGNGPPFPIGNQTDPIPMPGAGPLWLGINDDEVSDNQGELVVMIRVIPGRR